jgi:AcrR family transcriptional regulator
MHERLTQTGTRRTADQTETYEGFDAAKDDTLAAYRAVAEHVFSQMHPEAGEGDWSSTARVLLEPLVIALQSDPDAGRLLWVKGLTGGKGIRQERKRVVGEFERLVQAFLDSAPKDGSTLDIPATAVMGALRSIVSRHLRTHVEDRLPLAAEDGLAWVESYAIRAGGERFSTGPRALLNGAQARKRADRASQSLAGHDDLLSDVAAPNQHELILHATAEVMMAKGYARATVADIVTHAGVTREVFYGHFADKQHAFMEAQRHPTQFILDACASAYFSVDEWPERVWRGLRVLTALIARNPAISHLRLVECYAAGPAAIERAEEITRSFTFFLEEGYGYRERGRGLSRLCSEAIAGAIFEVIQRHVALGEGAELPVHLPQLAYIAITPFIGAEEAIDLVETLSARELLRHSPESS